jgi:hypothetical protein
MRALWYALLAAPLLAAAPAQSEVLRLKCVDAHEVLVVQYVIDTDRKRVDQILAGGRLTHPVVMSITEEFVRFVDRSGEATCHNHLHRATGELVSEIVEGPERGISLYMICRPTDE